MKVDVYLSKIQKCLIRNQKTLSVAESLTCGNVQSLIGSLKNASRYFSGGVTAYNLEQKVRLLKVSEKHAKNVNCVSKQVAKEMAKGVAVRFHSDLGISTTGFADMNPESEKRDQHAYIAIWQNCGNSRGRCILVKKIFPPKYKDLSRTQFQRHVANKLLKLLSYKVESVIWD